MEDAHKFLKIPKSECPDIWIRLPRHQWPKSWSSMEDPVVLLERNLYGHLFGRTIMGKAIWENPIETWLGENSKLRMSLCTSWKRIILICVCGWHTIGWKETQSSSDVETTQQRSRFGRTNIFPGSCVLGMHSKTLWNKQKYCGQLQNHVVNHEFPRRGSRNYHFLKIFVFLHGLLIWRAMQRDVWKDIVSWQRRRLSNSTEYLLHASMTTTSKRKNWNL